MGSSELVRDVLDLDTRQALHAAITALRKGDGAGWQALAPLSALSAGGTDISIDFTTEATLGAPVIIARPRAIQPPGLTPRQTEVARLLARGLSNKAIARDLGIAPATVKDHVAAILSALGLPTRAAVAALFHP